MKKLLSILVLCFSVLSMFGQAVEGDSCGHQIKRRVPITAFHSSYRDSTWSLIYYPDEYKDSTSKNYPVIFFCHGSGEGDPNYFTDNGNGSSLCIMLNNALPGQISSGLKPQAVANGKLYKFIVVSIQVWSGGSPGYAQLFNAFPYLKSILRMDTNRLYISGLSEGGYGTWDVLTNGTDSAFIKKFAAIIPQSAVTLEGYRLPFLRIASRDTIPVLVTCGSGDSFITSSTAYVDSINTSNPTPYVPAILLVRPGLSHQAAAWDSIYSVTFRPTQTGGRNGYEWMLQYVVFPRGPLGTNQPPVSNAGGNQSITLPTNSVTCAGSGTGQNGATISSYFWSQTSGPSTAVLSGAATATLTASSLVQGTYVFTLTVTDNHSLTGNNSAVITVNAAPVNSPPNVNAGANQTIFLPTSIATLSGTASGNNGATIAAVFWTKTSGPTCTITNPNVFTTTVTGMGVGTYIFSLLAQDGNGLTNTALTTIVVSPASTFVPKYIFGVGEYNNTVINTVTHHGVGIVGDTVTIPGMPHNVIGASGGTHFQGVIDSVGNVLLMGDNINGELGNGTTSSTPTTTLVKVATDSLGNLFTNVIQLVCSGSNFGFNTAALKNDGTVWAWGNLQGGNRGDGSTGGTYLRPVQVKFPAGVFIVKIQESIGFMALDANGNVWTWGASGQTATPFILGQNTFSPVTNVPTMLGLPSAAKDIAGSSLWNYALLTNGKLFGWSFFQGFIIIGSSTDSNRSSPSAQVFPQLLDTTNVFPKPVTSIYVNNEASYAILSDSTWWGWGGNDCGTIGQGFENTKTDWFGYTIGPSPVGGTPNPFAWSQSPGEPGALLRKAKQIAPGIHDFVICFGGTSLVFGEYGERRDGSMYYVGRNKGGVEGNGVIGADTIRTAIAAQFPNSWDEFNVTKVDPYNQSTIIRMTSPYCVTNPTVGACANYSNPSGTNPNCSAGSNQSILPGAVVTITGTASGNGGAVTWRYLWSNTGRPAGASAPLIVIPSGLSAQVSGMIVPGVYTFSLTATDSNWRTSTSTMTITVGPTGCNCLPLQLNGVII